MITGPKAVRISLIKTGTSKTVFPSLHSNDTELSGTWSKQSQLYYGHTEKIHIIFYGQFSVRVLIWLNFSHYLHLE